MACGTVSTAEIVRRSGPLLQRDAVIELGSSPRRGAMVYPEPAKLKRDGSGSLETKDQAVNPGVLSTDEPQAKAGVRGAGPPVSKTGGRRF